MSQPTPLVFSDTTWRRWFFAGRSCHRGSTCVAWRCLRLRGKPPAYILGHSYPHGVWFFFPSCSCSSPISLSSFARSRAGRWHRCASFRPVRLALIPEGMELHWRAVWVFLLVFTGACIFSRFQFSIRHFSVSLALLILMLAPLPRALESTAKFRLASRRVPASGSRSHWRWHRLRRQFAPIPTIFHS